MNKIWLIGALALIQLMATVLAQEVNWKNDKFARINALKDQQRLRQQQEISPNRINYFATMKENRRHFLKTLREILRPRTPGSPGSQYVRNFIGEEMRGLGWNVEVDSFEQNTVVGKVRFNNIIATLDPNAPRRLVLACHYDSKLTPKNFLGATDSAVPCAQMINLAHTMKLDLDDHTATGNQVTLQFIFFDGEEAFKTWTDTDSIYGARHLASKWEQDQYSYRSITGNHLDRIDLFVLLDLLGAKDPQIHSLNTVTEPWFRVLNNIEDSLTKYRAVSGKRIFQSRARNYGIEDDHVPFLKRRVPILHVIAVPFPKEWHTIKDNANLVHMDTVEKLNKIFRLFVAEYLQLS